MAAAGCNKRYRMKQLPKQRAKGTWQLLAITNDAGYMAAARCNKRYRVQLPPQNPKCTNENSGNIQIGNWDYKQALWKHTNRKPGLQMKTPDLQVESRDYKQKLWKHTN